LELEEGSLTDIGWLDLDAFLDVCVGRLKVELVRKQVTLTKSVDKGRSACSRGTWCGSAVCMIIIG
jgi:hypothetical protein